MKKRYTFDTIHRDCFPRQFLIRFATEKEKDDSFETLDECKEVLNKSMSMDVFISLEVLNYEEPEEEPTYELREDGIYIVGSHKVSLNEKIRNEEMHEYEIRDRKDFISTLIGWIAEARDHNKTMMQDDLEELMTWDDDYIFSSISTNTYIRQGDSEFDETCEALIELNGGL